MGNSEPRKPLTMVQVRGRQGSISPAEKVPEKVPPIAGRGGQCDVGVDRACYAVVGLAHKNRSGNTRTSGGRIGCVVSNAGSIAGEGIGWRYD